MTQIAFLLIVTLPIPNVRLGIDRVFRRTDGSVGLQADRQSVPFPVVRSDAIP